MKESELYIDGSCITNPGAIGFAVIHKFSNIDYYAYSRYEEWGTNNVAEISALILALEIFKDNLIIYSDSSYVVNGYNLWLTNWSLSNWQNSEKKTIANKDLWQKIYDLKKHIKNVKLVWIKSHTNSKCDNYNHLVDKLAKAASKKEVYFGQRFSIKR
jgi:ribonuclease HI